MSWTGYVSGTIVEKKDEQVYNYITQNKAAELSRAMYSSLGEFESDLMNSYAWDTAILFLQEFGESKYSIKHSVNNSLENKGTSATNYSGTRDVVCNIYDMSSNCYEWVTETTNSYYHPCGYRTNGCYFEGDDTNFRGYGGITIAGSELSFRPILYVK